MDDKNRDGLIWTVFGLGILTVILWPIWFVSMPCALAVYVCTIISYNQKQPSDVEWARTVGLILTLISSLGWIMFIGLIILCLI